MGAILLGCIADDFTGATDLANNLVRSGMRAIQTIGVPADRLQADVDAVVVALKSRTVPKAEAIEQSLAALRWLQAQGAQQIYFKYCSTFDSTAAGNIGPVSEALLDALRSDFTIATPAFPDNGRTVFRGYLFVGDALLNESGMQDHPLTPMKDANLVRVLQSQCERRVGLIDYRDVARGADAIRARIDALKAQGVAIAIVDAISNDDLMRLGPALRHMPLVTAGSGVAIGLPANFGLSASNAGERSAACVRVAGDRLRELLARHESAGARRLRLLGENRFASTHETSPGAMTLSAMPSRGRTVAWGPSPCSSIPPLNRTRSKSSSRCSERIGPVRRQKARSPRYHAAWSSAAQGSSWWRAEKPPARACRLLGSSSCGSVRRSMRACRGVTRILPWDRVGFTWP